MNQSLSNTNKNSTVLNSLILDEPEPNTPQKDQKVLSQKSSDSSLVKSEDEEFEPESIEESSQSDSKGGVGEQQTFEKTEGDSDAISEIDKNSLEDLQSSRILDESLNQFCLNLNEQLQDPLEIKKTLSLPQEGKIVGIESPIVEKVIKQKSQETTQPETIEIEQDSTLLQDGLSVTQTIFEPSVGDLSSVTNSSIISQAGQEIDPEAYLFTFEQVEAYQKMFAAMNLKDPRMVHKSEAKNTVFSRLLQHDKSKMKIWKLCARTDPSIHNLYEHEAIVALHLVHLLEYENVPLPKTLPDQLLDFIDEGKNQSIQVLTDLDDKNLDKTQADTRDRTLEGPEREPLATLAQGQKIVPEPKKQSDDASELSFLYVALDQCKEALGLTEKIHSQNLANQTDEIGKLKKLVCALRSLKSQSASNKNLISRLTENIAQTQNQQSTDPPQGKALLLKVLLDAKFQIQEYHQEARKLSTANSYLQQSFQNMIEETTIARERLLNRANHSVDLSNLETRNIQDRLEARERQVEQQASQIAQNLAELEQERALRLYQEQEFKRQISKLQNQLNSLKKN